MGDTVQLVRAPRLGTHADYADAAIVPAGSRLVFLAGACPLDTDGSTVAVGDYAGQARKCVDNLLIALHAAGAAITDVVNTRVLVASARNADLGAVWQVVSQAFGSHDVPSTLFGVTVLGYDDQLVEIEAVAAIDDSSQ